MVRPYPCGRSSPAGSARDGTANPGRVTAIAEPGSTTSWYDRSGQARATWDRVVSTRSAPAGAPSAARSAEVKTDTDGVSSTVVTDHRKSGSPTRDRAASPAATGVHSVSGARVSAATTAARSARPTASYSACSTSLAGRKSPVADQGAGASAAAARSGTPTYTSIGVPPLTASSQPGSGQAAASWR